MCHTLHSRDVLPGDVRQWHKGQEQDVRLELRMTNSSESSAPHTHTLSTNINLNTQSHHNNTSEWLVSGYPISCLFCRTHLLNLAKSSHQPLLLPSGVCSHTLLVSHRLAHTGRITITFHCGDCHTRPPDSTRLGLNPLHNNTLTDWM